MLDPAELFGAPSTLEIDVIDASIDNDEFEPQICHSFVICRRQLRVSNRTLLSSQYKGNASDHVSSNFPVCSRHPFVGVGVYVYCAAYC